MHPTRNKTTIVVASSEVADLALQRTYSIVTYLLAGRPDVPDVLEAMIKSRMYLIIGKDRVYTDTPEYRDHPNPAHQNERVRGTGGKPTSFGEQNLLSLPSARQTDKNRPRFHPLRHRRGNPPVRSIV